MRLLCLWVLIVLLASSCSLVDAGTSAAPDEQISSPPDSAIAFGDEPPATIAPEARARGGILRVGVVATTWDDPAAIDEANSGEQQLADLLFDGLTDMGADGVLSPAIASSWAADDDGLAWTFVISPAATFSDGSAVKPADVQRSIQRVIDRGVGSLAGNNLALVDTMEAADSSLRIVLDRPFAALPELLSAPIFGIVPSEREPEAPVPVTSGDLMVISQDGTKIDLVPRIGADGYLDGVSVQLFRSDAEVAEAFHAGNLDVASLDQMTAGASGDDSGASRVLSGTDTVLFMMNLGNEAFADPMLRQAMVLAVDNGFVAGGVSGEAVPLNGLLPSATTAFRPNVCADCPFQPDRAREIVGGYAAGSLPLLHVDHLDDPASEAMAAAIVSDLTFVGFEARARPHSPTAFSSKVAAGELSLFQFGVVGSWESSGAYLGSMFRTNGPDNVTSFSDAEVDRLLAEAEATADHAASDELYRQVEERILSLSVVVPLFERDRVVLVAPNVENLTLQPLGAFNALEVWLSDGQE